MQKPSEYTQSIQDQVMTYLSQKQKATRNELFKPALSVFNLSQNDLKDRKPGGNYSIANSMIGIVINEMIKLETIIYQDDHLVMNQKTVKTNPKEMVEFFSKKYLTEDELKEKGPESKMNVIKSLIGNLFKQKADLNQKTRDDVLEIIQNEIEKSKKIRDKLYSKDTEITYPVSPIGNLLREHHNKYIHVKKKNFPLKDYEESLQNTVGSLFGQAEEFFEGFVFNLIKKIYGTQIIKERFLAGPDDDGVDCEFVIRDPFGFTEKLIIQAKTKKTDKNLNIKVLREYLGVMVLKNAQKCVIITNSNFNKTAKDAAKHIHSMVLIGLDDLIKYMKTHRYGIILDDDGYFKIDEEMFLAIA